MEGKNVPKYVDLSRFVSFWKVKSNSKINKDKKIKATNLNVK